MPQPSIKLLEQDYFLILSTPHETTSGSDIDPHVREHLAWLLALEAEGVVVMSGPLLEGPGAAPGAGVTVLRATDRHEAESIAASDPFVIAGLRRFDVFKWRVNEGSVSVTLSLGTGTFDWR